MEASVSIATHPVTTALSGPERMYWTLFLTKEEAGHLGGRGTTETHPMRATLSSDTFSLWAFILQRTLGLTPGWEERLGDRSSTQMSPEVLALSEPEEVCRTLDFGKDIGRTSAPQKCPFQ